MSNWRVGCTVSGSREERSVVAESAQCGVVFLLRGILCLLQWDKAKHRANVDELRLVTTSAGKTVSHVGKAVERPITGTAAREGNADLLCWELKQRMEGDFRHVRLAGKRRVPVPQG